MLGSVEFWPQYLKGHNFFEEEVRVMEEVTYFATLVSIIDCDPWIPKCTID